MRIELPEWGERTSEERREMFREGHAHSVRGRYMTIVALVELEESRGFLDLGYRSVQEFARKEGGWSRRQVSYLLSAGRRLKELWRVDAALRDGSLCWSKVRLVVSVATAATEEEWLAKAMTMTTDQLEHHVQSVREPIVRQGRVLLPSIPQRLYRKYQELLKELRAQREQPHLDDERGFEELLNLAARALGREDLVDKQPNQDLDAHQGDINRNYQPGRRGRGDGRNRPYSGRVFLHRQAHRTDGADRPPHLHPPRPATRSAPRCSQSTVA